MLLQVLLAFTITACLTICLAWSSYLFGPYDAETNATMNVLDEQILRWLSLKRSNKGLATLPNHSKAVLRQMILILSDTHLVTGAAILLAGFTQACRLTIYHYVTVVYLGWLCSATHMATLTILRPYLRLPENRPVLRWRLLAMSVVWTLLFAALWLTGSSHWPLLGGSGYYVKGLTPLNMFYFDSPIVCTWRNGYIRTPSIDTILSICILTLGFISRVLKLFESSANACQRIFVDAPGSWLKRRIELYHSKVEAFGNAGRLVPKGSKMLLKVKRFSLLVIYINARSVRDLYTSMFSELLWLTLSMLWGLSKVFSYRRFSPVATFEQSWSFGQLLPMFLLVLPLVSLPELAAEARASEERRAETHKSSTTSEVAPLTAKQLVRPVQKVTTDKIESNQPTQVPSQQVYLFQRSESMYRYTGFYILLLGYAFPIYGVFTFLVAWQLRGHLSAARILLDPLLEGIIWVPLLFGPLFIWTFLVAPFSRLVRLKSGPSEGSAGPSAPDARDTDSTADSHRLNDEIHGALGVGDSMN